MLQAVAGLQATMQRGLSHMVVAYFLMTIRVRQPRNIEKTSHEKSLALVVLPAAADYGQHGRREQEDN